MNYLLERFPELVRKRLLSISKEVDLYSRKELYRAESPLRFIYFLTRGMASIVATMHDGGSVEVGMVGNEGLVGVTALLGSPQMTSDCFIQIAGAGYRVPLADMQHYFMQDEQVRTTVLAFLRSQVVTAERLTACSKLHEADARLARWLLMASDRTQTDDLHLTQEFLSEMIGTRRTTVALVAGEIQRHGCIEYSRGRVKITDREKLTKLACECYALTRQALRPAEANQPKVGDSSNRDIGEPTQVF